jgi:ribonuclease-3
LFNFLFPVLFYKSFSKDKRLVLFLKNLLGYYPKNLNYYKQALRHKSASNIILKGVKDNNERLEFLGDAILSTVIANYLYSKFPLKDEGFLTKMRSRIVSRDNINRLSKKLGLHEFVETVKHNNTISKSYEGDALEAIIGAVFMDFGYKKTEHFIVNRLVNIHLNMDEIEHTEIDFKSRVIEYSHKEKKSFEFVIDQEGGKGQSDYYKISLFIGIEKVSEGVGKSKKGAEQQASEKYCKELGIT